MIPDPEIYLHPKDRKAFVKRCEKHHHGLEIVALVPFADHMTRICQCCECGRLWAEGLDRGCNHLALDKFRASNTVPTPTQ